jgi:hypothetical protein
VNRVVTVVALDEDGCVLYVPDGVLPSTGFIQGEARARRAPDQGGLGP